MENSENQTLISCPSPKLGRVPSGQGELEHSESGVRAVPLTSKTASQRRKLAFPIFYSLSVFIGVHRWLKTCLVIVVQAIHDGFVNDRFGSGEELDAFARNHRTEITQQQQIDDAQRFLPQHNDAR